MIYALRLFEVDAAKCVAFTSAFDQGGLWYETAAKLPGHLFTQLLRHEGKRQIYLAFEFWDTEELFLLSRKSVSAIALHYWAQSAARYCLNLGTFHFRNADHESTSCQNPRIGKYEC